MEFGEVQWPFNAVTFGLPRLVIQEYTGYSVDVPFISGALFPHKTIVDPLSGFPELVDFFQLMVPRVEIDKPRQTIVFADMRDTVINQLVTASYGSSYHLGMKVNDLEEMEYHKWSSLDLGKVKLNLTPEAEEVVNRKLCLLFHKLLVVLTCQGPRYVDPLVQLKKERFGKHQRAALWRVPFVGRAYTLPRDPVGTHTAPNQHLRRRHVIRQAVGPREKLVYVTSLPRTPDGKTDWDAVTDELKQAFWASHQYRVIEDLIVSPNDRETAHRPPVV
jgi:hypothetical protein